MDRERDRRPSYNNNNNGRGRYPPDGGGHTGYRPARSPPRHSYREHYQPSSPGSRRPQYPYNHPPSAGPPGPSGPPPQHEPYPRNNSLGGGRRSNGDYRRRSRSPPSAGGYRGDGMNSNPSRRFSQQGGNMGPGDGYRGRSPPRPDGRYRGRDRSPPPPMTKRGRDVSPNGVRGDGPDGRSPMMGGPPPKRERLDSPPRDRFGQPRGRGHSPRYSPPRERAAYRPRSRSPRRDDRVAAESWRSGSPPPAQSRGRQEYFSGENSSRESADTSRRSSPPRSRMNNHNDPGTFEDRPYRGYPNNQPSYRGGGRSPRGREPSPPRGHDHMADGGAPPRHSRPYRDVDNSYDRPPPSGPAGPPRGHGPPSAVPMGPPSGPEFGRPSTNPILSAPSRPRGGGYAGRGGYSREPPPMDHRREYGGPPPSARRPSNSWSGPPSGRGGGGPPPGAHPGSYGGPRDRGSGPYDRDRERGGADHRQQQERYDDRGGYRDRGSYDRERTGSMHHDSSYQQHSSHHRYPDRDHDRDRGDRGSFGGPPHHQGPPGSHRGFSNSTSTTYPRTQRFQNNSTGNLNGNGNGDDGHEIGDRYGNNNHGNDDDQNYRQYLSDLPAIVPGGEKEPAPFDTAKIEKLEDEAKRLRDLIAEKQATKRQGLREWEKLEREGEGAKLRSELAEGSLRGLNGEAEMGGPAF